MYSVKYICPLAHLFFSFNLTLKVQKDVEREAKEDCESDREGSGSASEDMASPCTQQNGR